MVLLGPENGTIIAVPFQRNIQYRSRLKDPFQFFFGTETFEIFLMSPKGPPSIFLIF